MTGIKFKSNQDTVWEALQISKKRIEDIDYRMQLILHDFFKPTKSKYLPSTDVIIKLFVALAENEQELVYVSYMAGMKVEEIFGYELAQENEIEDED